MFALLDEHGWLSNPLKARLYGRGKSSSHTIGGRRICCALCGLSADYLATNSDKKPHRTHPQKVKWKNKICTFVHFSAKDLNYTLKNEALVNALQCDFKIKLKKTYYYHNNYTDIESKIGFKVGLVLKLT